MLDSRPVHIKIVAGRFVTVLPPTDQRHDDTVWRTPKAGAHHTLMRRVSLIDGLPSGINDYITTKADKLDVEAQSI